MLFRSANDEQYNGSTAAESMTAQEIRRRKPDGRMDRTGYAAANRVRPLNANEKCPQVTIINELAALHQFTNPAKPSPAGSISSIMMSHLDTNCTYNRNNVVVELNLTFEGTLGARAKVWNTDRASFAYPYFLAITTPSGTIAAKEIFAIAFSYDKNQDTVSRTERIRQIIPLNGDYSARNSILIGFQLTGEELAYNRSLKDVMVVPSQAAEKTVAKKQPVALKKPVPAAPAHKPERVVAPPVPVEPEPVAVIEEVREEETSLVVEEESEQVVTGEESILGEEESVPVAEEEVIEVAPVLQQEEEAPAVTDITAED